MKTIITLLLCISIATAQSPDAITSKATNKLSHKPEISKLFEKLKQLNTPELRKSQKYAELRREIRKELRDMKQETTKATQPFGMQTKQVMQYDTLQKYKITSTNTLSKAFETTTCYDVPLGSKGNTIELEVTNNSTSTVEWINVEAASIPEGIQFKEKTITLTELKTKEEQSATFTFSIERTAKVNKIDTVCFSITDKSGKNWKKEITIKITTPTNYELFQNYPNPFNPTTVIEYQLPGAGTRYIVSLKIYDLLGREVASLVNEQQDAGYYQKTFDAHRFTSGMYIYRLLATDDQNNLHSFQKKMMILK